MVRHHQKEHERGYKRNIVINAVGSVATLIVLLIVATTKFTSGAWVPLVVIPLIVVAVQGRSTGTTRPSPTVCASLPTTSRDG